jgi:ligand-binding sensor domain-containing protein
VEDSENSKGYKEVIKRFNNETETWDRSYDREFTTTSLYSDSKGNLWVGTEEGGLATLIPQEEKWSVVGSGETGVQIDYITAIQEDKHGNMWIGTGSSGGWQAYGLIQRKVDGSWVEMGQSDLPSNVVEEITDDGKGGILVGTLRDAVRRTKEGKWESFDLDPGTFNSIEGIYQDSQGGLWVTSFGEGLFYRNSAGEIKRINKENSNIPSDFVVLYVDSRKNLWVTTPDAGFAKMREDGSFEVFNTTNSGLPSNYNTTLEEDGQGGLWVGTGSWTEINSDLDFIYDDSGHVITHEGQGLTHLNAPGEWGKVLNTGNSQLPDNDITVSLSDNRGGIWIGTPKGLAHYKADGEWEIFKTDSPELPGNRVSGLLTDESGGLWVGMATWFENDEKGLPSFDAAGQPVISSRSGLAYRDAGGKWILFDSHNSGLPDATVVKLHPDGTGGLWIGTRGGGLVHLTFGHKTEVCTQTDAATCQALQTSKRAAIIIAGGGNDAENDLWDATESITAYLYKVLNKRGFDNDEIYYLSPKDWADFNGDGLNDGIVDAPKPERALKPEDVQEALNWAKQKEKLGQPLYIFFVDHGGTGLDKIAQLQLAKLVYFYAPELKAMLDDYQKETGNQVVMVIDACYSGAFVQQLAAPNRAIISSADTNELAKFVDKQGFSRFFAEGLNSGNSFAEAFGNARLKQQKLIGNSTQQTVAGATEGSSKMTQTPQLDDNGDGTFTTDNTAARDGQWLTQVHLNGNFTTGDLTLAVEIADKETLPATLTAGQPLLLKAKAGTASGGVEQVWAVIRPPRMNLVIGPNGTPILAFPRQPLSRNSTDKLLWEAAWDWDKAVYNGDYDITFYAQDNEKNIASSDSVVIKVEGGIDPPPQATVQLQLSKDRYQRGEPFQAQLVEELGWGYDLYAAVVMPSGEILSLKHPNDMAVVNLATNQASPWLEPRKQHQPITLFDLPTLPENWSTGKYYLYGILSPEKANVFETLDKNLWVMDMKSFEIVP